MEERLKGKIGRGEELKEIFIKNYPNLLSLSSKILKDLEEAKDVVQEAFLKAMENIKNIRKEESIRTWLLRIVYRLAIDKKRRICLLKKKIYELTGVGKFKNELDFEISEFLERLKPKEREAIYLRAEGFNSREIGEIIGCSESTVRVHLHNARKKIKKFIEG
jgi:RNA polymerase sigma-70 factor (ECF subfamily)